MTTADDTNRVAGPGATIAPLTGIRVLELGNYIAAPTAGRMLADFGAEVIKVERPRTGDEVRNWRLYAGTTSLLFRTINRNKKSIVLDLRTDAGRDVVRQLVEHCDVVLENFRPGTLEKWGLGPDALKAINPELILTRISAFGQTGPMAAQPGFAAVAEAHGGLRALVGEPDRPPARVGVSIADTIAGLQAGFGTVMALYARETRRRDGLDPRDTGNDFSIIDVALNESVLSVTESLVPDYLAYQVERQRTGGRMEGIAPSNAYACKDGSSVVIAGNGDAIFRRFMTAIGRPDLLADPGLATNAGRWESRDELDAAIEAWTSTCTRDEVLAVLTEADVPAGAINTAADICIDEQLLARNMIQSLAVDATGDGVEQQIGFPGIVPVYGGVSLPIGSLGPDLGAHTDEVLRGLLGLEQDLIDAATDSALEPR
ncbi:CaiB/BaiF CoA-transferase family protein [Nocardioides sp. cx-173]|uniref:CaiB/BaiF CoA transferase family protein n=1 Tax=Nocardioides sp. cx-173 TaxID=2898796 RepID=UPI001E55474A|nr:CoA transferase [Nocardioides sp. cx-173]MCD4524213.1 CoA transferase [Nocardioides sp. cx-173]UGB41605.1 CoA transferase [Nocardioides sp. cx-173]